MTFSKFKGEISTVGVIVNPKIEEKDYNIIEEILEYLEENNLKIFLEKSLTDKIKHKFDVKDIKDLYADVILTFGGDGTILHSLQELPNDPLILGINFGKIGFLTELNKKNAREGIKKLLSKNFYVEKRTMLLINKKYNALNELVVSGEFPANLLDFVVILNNSKLKYKADGIIVATQTGSTAYSLSLGGPILHPRLNAFVITPINPFLQRSKSIVVNDKTKISIVVESGRVNTHLIVDGKRMETVELGKKIFIEKSKKEAKFVRFKNKWNIKKII